MIDHVRIRLYLDTFSQEMDALQQALASSDEEIQARPLILRGMKYSVVVIAEVMAEICQHILAKQHKVSVSGFSETLAKAASLGILSEDLQKRLAPFLRFRNMLVHGYWKVDDAQFLRNLRSGIGDFDEFAKCIKDQFISNPSSDAVGPF